MIKEIEYLSKDFEEVLLIYNEAFPINEQMDLPWLFTKLKKGKILGYYQNNQLSAFTIICLHQNILNILYLAVDKKYRNQGIGSKIISYLTDNYSNYQLILDIEQIKEVENKQQRIKRKQFYLNNGFKESEVKYIWQNEEYVVLHKNGILTEEIFWNFWETLKNENTKT